MRLYVDGESVGLCGSAKLFQYAIDNGPVQFIPLMRGWERSALVRGELERLWDYLNLPDTLFIGFNTAFDLNLLLKTFHRWKGLAYDSPERPVNPFKCKVLDLQTHAIRNSPLSPFAFSKGAARSVAAVRRIPRVVSDLVRARVEERLRPLLPSVCELKSSEHEVPGKPHLVTLSWHTDTRLSLKNLMKTYGLPTIPLAEVWPLPEKGSEKPWLPYPTEVHDALEPMCDAILSDRSLPFWKYAELDIHYLRVLESKLGQPQPDHHDTCTHVVAYTRYYGFSLDRPVLERTREAYAKKVAAAQAALEGTDLASPKQRLALLKRYDPLIASSSKKVIEVLANSDRPSAPVARAMIEFGMFTQRLNQVEKVLECRTGRAHPDLRIMGTRTGRTAGSAGLNWQGIAPAKNGLGIRAAVETAAGGDFDQFEVCIAAAAFPDAMIQADIDEGIDQHTMNATLMHPKAKAKGWTYEAMLALVKAKDPDAVAIRKATKAVSFALQFFAQAKKVAETLGISMTEAEHALDHYYGRYAGFGAYKTRIEKETQTADTEHWSRDSVRRMAREMTDLTGFKMKWDFEAAVAEALWELGGSGIRTGRDGTIIRTPEKGPQTYDGAVRSALLGGAIAIQAAVTRQRGNSRVQATGGNLAKMLTARLWDTLRTPILLVHDEVQMARHPNYDHKRAKETVDSFIQEWRGVVKSISMDYRATSRWSDK